MADVIGVVTFSTVAVFDDQPAATYAACRQACEQIDNRVFRRAAGDPTTREPHRFAFNLAPTRGHALPERFIDDAEMLVLIANPLRLGTVGGRPLAPTVSLARLVPNNN